MQKTWFTADTHFGHASIVPFCKRPFGKSIASAENNLPEEQDSTPQSAIEQHDAALLDAINARVSKEDTLWILGDFCWGKFQQAEDYRQRIRCRDVRLVWGNHDHRSIAPVFQQSIEQGQIRVRRQKIWLNHYPMRYWDKSFHGSWQLYGHVHGRLQREDAMENWRLTRDVGVDACDYRPISFEELAEYMKPRLVAFLERKAQGHVH